MTTTDPPTAQPETPPPKTGPAEFYRGTVIAVGTRHGKQRPFAGPFAEVLGARLHTPVDLDTDRFGTFTGERPRRIGALEAARAKANLALEVTGLTLGLASEASYGPLPGTGLPGHEEILLFCDLDRGIEVIEGYRSALVPGPVEQVAAYSEISRALLDGLPDQALIVRPAGSGTPVQGSAAVDAEFIVKGITRTTDLRAAVDDAVAACPTGLAVVEPDLRAHHNPIRRRVLRHLAATMARRLATGCPSCGTPGFGRVDAVPGLPCAVCATATPLIGTEIHRCCRCEFTESRPVASAPADPRLCPLCNP